MGGGEGSTQDGNYIILTGHLFNALWATMHSLAHSVNYVECYYFSTHGTLLGALEVVELAEVPNTMLFCMNRELWYNWFNVMRL